MCDKNNASCARDGKTDARVSLLDLPIEIFLHICSFLEASTLAYTLSPVCKQFYLILRDDSLWKARVNRMWTDASYPVLRLAKDNNLFWRLACVALEKQMKLWRHQDSMEKLLLTDVQYSTIDALLLMHGGTTCISGARDRSLVYWKLPTQEYESEKAACIEQAHNGWIWDLTAIDNTIYSCSWDHTIKSWLLTNTGLVHLKTYETGGSDALLCVSSCAEQEVFAAGSYSSTVFVFDSRSGHKPIVEYHPHSRAVIKLAMNSSYILSASEDKKVTIWDQRARQMLRCVNISKNAFPMCMSMHRDWVYVGDSAAELHVLNPKKDFAIAKSYVTGHKKGITGVHQTRGCLITSSTDGTVRISSPTDPPKCLATLTFRFGEVASMDYLNSVLAISGTDGIEIWRPKSMCSNQDQ
ncbi:F-box/WD repeat-containing protein 9 isoform X1 [Harpegnathos saltator]|uniref:F-box/WD repeat-containing protein 9 n=2 Tax=Harpegnathos saltator TaxID=610380 RepID=E2BEL3_HARSA|nr:F-box/WD repeat-containing protein 9 isoform X1 [Harpegnathos saltator]EFN85847.1 F-box/WD repeat-containing protein 9 [Harpegnathos saltator]